MLPDWLKQTHLLRIPLVLKFVTRDRHWNSFSVSLVVHFPHTLHVLIYFSTHQGLPSFLAESVQSSDAGNNILYKWKDIPNVRINILADRMFVEISEASLKCVMRRKFVSITDPVRIQVAQIDVAITM